MPADGLDDAVELIVGRRVVAAHWKHEVDGIKQAGEGLGEVGCLIGLQRVLQGFLWAAQRERIGGTTEDILPDKKCKRKVLTHSYGGSTDKRLPLFSRERNRQSGQKIAPLYAKVGLKDSTFQISKGTMTPTIYLLMQTDIFSSKWRNCLC